MDMPLTSGKRRLRRYETTVRKSCLALLTAVIVPLLLHLPAGGAVPPPLETDANGYAIIINLPAMELHLYRYGVPVKRFPIGIGNVVSPSKLGSTRIVNSVTHPTYYPPNWYLRGLAPIPPGPENPVGTRWLGLGWSGYGIHGTNNPASIGTASSSGCIRMYNEDVEELAALVGPGTPVTFVYEPIEIWNDPLTGRTLLRVHPDIYRTGKSSVHRVITRLAEEGVSTERVSLPGLSMLLAEATGEPTTLPIELQIVVDGSPVEGGAFSLGGLSYVSLHRIAAHLGEELLWTSGSDAILVNGTVVHHVRWIGSELFASPESAALALGLGWHVHTSEWGGPDNVELFTVPVVYDGHTVPFRGRPERFWVLLPVEEVAEVLGIEIRLDHAHRSMMVEGKPVFGLTWLGEKAYLPHDLLASVFGISAVWDSQGRVVHLRRNAVFAR